MNFIIEFYKELDTLNLIIFWGIITVIILLLIFSFLLISKNKKLKKLVVNKVYEEELPIKKEDDIEEKTNIKNEEITQSQILEEQNNNEINQENNLQNIETEKQFVAEEHVMEYNKDLFSLSNIKKVNEYEEEKTSYDIKYDNNQITKMPTAPYQRNVLREMSLSQTSPIGINKPIPKEEKKTPITKDLEETLNVETAGKFKEEAKKINNEVKANLITEEKTFPRKTEILTENKSSNNDYKEKKEELNKSLLSINNTTIKKQNNEIIHNQSISLNEKYKKTSSEKYLEEVSKKLAEAEVKDEIERTNYELEQEENAIISYKELMEKKDSIQTIDEEDAIISIEELMNHHNQNKEDDKLYKLNEEEENDNFIKELKQFRNDL